MRTGIEDEVMSDVMKQAVTVEQRFSSYSSTHEALGVITEEMWELTQAIRTNYAEDVRREAIDIAVACLRLASQCRISHESGLMEEIGEEFADRSGFNVA